MWKILRRIGSFILYGFCIIALLIGMYSMAQRLMGNQQPMIFGWGAAVVQTGSMEPNVPVGTLIFIHEKDEYRPGEVITYIDYRDWSITHRVISVDGNVIVTKGDANNAADPAFDKSAIIGKAEYMIKGVGPVLDFITQPFVLGLLFVLLIISVVWDGIITNKRKQKAKMAFRIKQKSVVENCQIEQKKDLAKMFSVKK